MENILKEINAKIKEIAQSEEIDTQKLTELINMRDRLKGYNTTSISQVQGFNQLAMPVPNAPFNPPIFGTNRNSIYDSIIDVANIFLKNSQKQIENKNVNDLIYYHKFISELESSMDQETNTERFETKNDIEFLIMKEFKNIIKERKDKEKDKIIETALETKWEAQT